MSIERQWSLKDTEPGSALFCAKPVYPGQFFFCFYKDLLQFLKLLAGSGHPISFCQLAGQKIFMIDDPELIKDMFVSHYERFSQEARWLRRSKCLLGETLVTSAGDAHRRKRRILQPVLHHQRLQSYAKVVVRHALKVSDAWSDGEQVNLTAQMMRTSWAIGTEAFFGGEIEADTGQIATLISRMIDSFFYTVGPLSSFLELIGHPRVKEAFNARDDFNQIVQRMIDARRMASAERNDLLSLLLSAQEDETAVGLSDTEVRDETRILLIASHETVSNAICWPLFLLAQHEEVAARLRDEVRRVLGKSLPSMAHFEKLPFLNQVIRESLRLYPPGYMILREASEAFKLGDVPIPKVSILIAAPWTVQRSERFYPDPLQFRPECWTPGFRNSLPKYAFFPSGGGPRQCIGEGFAWMELTLLLAILVRDWDFRLVPNRKIFPKPAMTVRSSEPIQMIVERAD